VATLASPVLSGPGTALDARAPSANSSVHETATPGIPGRDYFFSLPFFFGQRVRTTRSGQCGTVPLPLPGCEPRPAECLSVERFIGSSVCGSRMHSQSLKTTEREPCDGARVRPTNPSCPLPLGHCWDGQPHLAPVSLKPRASPRDARPQFRRVRRTGGVSPGAHQLCWIYMLCLIENTSHVGIQGF